MTDIILETFRASVLLGILVFLWISGRHRFERLRKGWRLIIAGFGLLLFGSLLDISDNFEVLNSFVVIGDTDTEAFLEKFVGFLGGFVFLAIGLIKWIPGVQGMSDLVDARTKELQEINEVLQLEVEERKRAEKVKQEFISTVSHELRTPLTSIKGSLGIIRSGVMGDLSDKAKSLLDIAYRNSDRLVLLINDILDVEKIESGKFVLDMKPVRISELLKEAMEANRGYGVEQGVNFICLDYGNDLVTFGDQERLLQVLSNLMSNAAKFSPDGEQVKLSAEYKDGTICIAVMDVGEGIPEAFQKDIFEKFTQADASDTRKKGGTGLGLNISKSIVEQHGGTIGFESEINVGTTFFFILPKME